jgi:hypothetical protein|tara:strand:- start:1157 stop:1351 length:195 start_codon:yes stop_codon:yes gene_type:complete
MAPNKFTLLLLALLILFAVLVRPAPTMEQSGLVSTFESFGLSGGGYRDRTCYLLNANQALSQMS